MVKQFFPIDVNHQRKYFLIRYSETLIFVNFLYELFCIHTETIYCELELLGRIY